MRISCLLFSWCCVFCVTFSCTRATRQQSAPVPSILRDFEANKTDPMLPDFSYAGYNYGKELPPVRKDLPYFGVVDFGAVPNDGKDDIDAIQKAIDAAAAAGGGIVVFPSGTFDFDVNTEKRFLSIRHSDIIIRGNGSGIEGTILHDHTASSYPDPAKKWLSGIWPSFIYAGSVRHDSAWVLDAVKMAPVAAVRATKRFSTKIDVDDVSRLAAGKIFLLAMNDPDSSLAFSLVSPFKKLAPNYLSPKQTFRFQNIVTITAIEGNTVTLSAPVLWDLREKWKPALWPLPEMLSGVGIEGIRFRTDWSEAFIHHKNSVHDNGWDHIRFSFARNSWVRNVVCENATTGVSLHSSTHCTVTDVQIVGNPGHNGFGVNGLSTYNLLQNLVGGRAMHTYTLNGFVSGNVFHNCYSDEPSSIDGHGGLGVYNLFDSMYGGVFQNGGSNNNVPPATGGKTVFWNWEMGVQNPYNGRVKPLVAKVQLIPGFIAVGVKGGRGQPVYFEEHNGEKIYTDHKSEWCYIEKMNEKVFPPSLYRYQLAKRK